MICKECGHPNVDVEHYMPRPDPRRYMVANCIDCKRSVVYDDHCWTYHSPVGVKIHLCCSCYKIMKERERESVKVPGASGYD